MSNETWGVGPAVEGIAYQVVGPMGTLYAPSLVTARKMADVLNYYVAIVADYATMEMRFQQERIALNREIGDYMQAAESWHRERDAIAAERTRLRQSHAALLAACEVALPLLRWARREGYDPEGACDAVEAAVTKAKEVDNG